LKPQRLAWQPLLTGNSAALAREAVSVILDELAGPKGPQPAAYLDPAGPGPALLFSYLAACSPDDPHLPAVGPHLEAALRNTPEGPLHACLYGGLAGLGWGAIHVQAALHVDSEEIAEEIDDTLAEYLDRSSWTDAYDLISGLVGLGVYALERLPCPSAKTCLELILSRLTETAERRPEGLTWWSHPNWIGEWSRARCPHGYYNLGVAHGVPGVIGLLGGVIAADVDVSRARPLLEGAVDWLLSQDPPDELGYPFWLEARSGTPHRPSRVAWCYGDAGIAAALLSAARAAGEATWEGAARRIARRAARRPPQDCGIADACLCHGAAGLGHLFNRLYQATDEPELGEAARFWFEQTFALRQPGKAVAGFPSWEVVPGGEKTWVASAGFLNGAAGVGLALLAAVAPVEPTWDRILLVSLRPAAGGGEQ
jgi:hypothetical protein